MHSFQVGLKINMRSKSLSNAFLCVYMLVWPQLVTFVWESNNYQHLMMFLKYFSAQFEYIPGQVLEKVEDSVVHHVLLPMQCADFCISNQGFICNSFDFCPNDQTCRLSKQHIGDGTAVLSSSRLCDHFSSKC